MLHLILEFRSFLNKSKSHYEQKESYDSLSNIYIHLGYTYHAMDDIVNSCAMFDSSMKANETFMEKNPDAQVVLEGSSSFKDHVEGLKDKAGCKKI